MKARAWTGKKYVYDFFIDAKTGKPFYYQHMEGNIYPEGWTVEQYTGLKDKNGVEDLFQHDILKSLHYCSNGKSHYLYHVIEWSEKYSCWIAVNVEHYQNGIFDDIVPGNVYLWTLTKFEQFMGKCGTIHENPELLCNVKREEDPWGPNDTEGPDLMEEGDR